MCSSSPLPARRFTHWRKPMLEDAPTLVVVFRQAYGLRSDPATGEVRKVKHYYSEESVGIAVGLLLAACLPLQIEADLCQRSRTFPARNTRELTHTANRIDSNRSSGTGSPSSSSATM
jgi:hypothetical protein